VKLVVDYCRELSSQGALIFVDPIMGDGGRLYNGMTLNQVALMREMVSVADLCFPNYTEATLLTGRDFRKEGLTIAEAYSMVDDIHRLGSKSVLITSSLIDGKNMVVGYNHYTDEYFALEYEEIPGLFHGTGDLFSAVLIAHLLKGEPLKESTRTAMDTIYRLLEINKDMKDRNRGILIEQFLDVLDK